MTDFLLKLQRFADDSGDNTSSDAGESVVDNGTQDTAAAETEVTFDDLIGKNGKYKADFDDRVQKIIGKKFKEAKKTSDKLAALDPVLDVLSNKYGVDREDIGSIVQAVQGDDAMYEDRALEMGLSVDQYKNISRMQAENARLKAEKAQASAQEIYSRIEAEAESLKAEFPEFDIEACLSDDRFVAMYKNGVDMRSAYFALNADNILPKAMEITAKEIAKKTASNIAARGSRPMENGLSGQAAANVTTDVSKLSNDQIADLVKRAGKGERIQFS